MLQQIIRAVLYAVQFTSAYLIMLISMSFNGYILLSIILGAMIGFAFVFTLRLKYGEFVVLRAFCPWCAVNAAAVLLTGTLAVLDARRLRRQQQGQQVRMKYTVQPN